MCEECRQNPCHPRCPNAPEPQPVYICDKCDEGIYDGETVYELDGRHYCEYCVDEAKFTAEAPEPYEPDEDAAYERWRDMHLEEELW